jgi:hypothetical protein
VATRPLALSPGRQVLDKAMDSRNQPEAAKHSSTISAACRRLGYHDTTIARCQSRNFIGSRSHNEGGPKVSSTRAEFVVWKIAGVPIVLFKNDPQWRIPALTWKAAFNSTVVK